MFAIADEVTGNMLADMSVYLSDEVLIPSR